jgi:hypothetical protein
MKNNILFHMDISGFSIEKFTGEMMRITIGLITILLLLSTASFAGKIKKEENTDQTGIYVPEPLKPWVKWVLQKDKEYECPGKNGDSGKVDCIWPSEMNMEIQEKKGNFSMSVRVFADGIVQIPGDSVYWPYDVKSDGKMVPVISIEGFPAIVLEKGTFKVTGTFKWDQKPGSIKIPDKIGLINVAVNGKNQNRFTIDNDHYLWLKDDAVIASNISTSTDKLNVKVYRKIIDEIPIYILTQISLSVSGSEREEVFGKCIIDSSIPVFLHSDLPVKIDNEGNLRVQVRPGAWNIEIKTRLNSTINKLSMVQKTDNWPLQEIWAFEARPYLRTVRIAGVPPIDPVQTDIPDEWRQLPVFLVTPQKMFEIIEEYRGDAVPTPNNLRLEREMWLDFNGNGFTINDKIYGAVTRSGRLGMYPGYALGSVSLDGVPQLVTVISNNPGIEYRQGNLNLECLSRLDLFTTWATGWDQAFSDVSVTVNTPPGWKLFHLSGIDFVNDSWVSSWTVWDIFLLLIIVVSFFRIFNIKWAIVALCTLLLLFHESYLLIFLMLNLVAGLALCKVMPSEGKFSRFVNYYTLISLIIIVIAGVQFSVTQFKVAMYPQLEHKKSHESSMVDYDRTESRNVMKSVSSLRKKVQSSGEYLNREQELYDENAKIQTGPGKPAWGWNSFSYGWSGPVESDQMIRYYFIHPVLSRVLCVLRVLFLLLLLGCIGFTINKYRYTKELFGKILSGKNLLILLGLFLAFPSKNYAEIPPKEMLDELTSRLITNVPCLPDCISITKGSVEINDNNVKVNLQIDAVVTSSIALPGNRNGWFPDKISINGKDSPVLKGTDDGGLEAVIPEGCNDVVLSGKVLANRFEIQFPIQVNNFTSDESEWVISGISKGKIQGGLIKLEKVEKEKKGSVQPGSARIDQAMPFMEVTRNIIIDKEWKVKTTVRKIAPENDPLSLRIPLLTNESIISNIAYDNLGFIMVYMGKDQQEFSWESMLKVSGDLILEMSKQDMWVERWTLDHSPKWHIETSGLTQIKKDASSESLSMEWHPRAGEKVILNISQPGPVAGSTITIQNVHIQSSPGKKTSSNTMTMKLISSQADRVSFRLNADVILENVMVDNRSQIVAINKGLINIPVHPGEQEINLRWKDKNGISLLTKSPEIDCGMSGTNANVEITVPQERIVLFTGGPLMGPALLFWAMLIVLLIISVGLGLIPSIPLKWYHWFLLSAGMSTVENIGSVFMVLWFLAIVKRTQLGTESKIFNLWQVVCVLLTLIAMGSLIATIPMGLLRSPDMQIVGNYSSSYSLNWYQDITSSMLPQGWFISVPIWIYRLLMLLWSLWLAFYLTKWIKWAWQAFSAGGIWKSGNKKPDKPKVPKGLRNN